MFAPLVAADLAKLPVGPPPVVVEVVSELEPARCPLQIARSRDRREVHPYVARVTVQADPHGGGPAIDTMIPHGDDRRSSGHGAGELHHVEVLVGGLALLDL